MEQRHAPTVMLVEDEPIIADLYETILGRKPYHIVKAFNKTSAIELIQEHRPSLILLDLMIPIGPGEDLITYDHPVGFDILEWIRDHPDLTHTKVVVLTNLESDAHREHAEHLGAAEYLVKVQHDPHDIAAKVDTLLSAARNAS
jgi:CheY-like chemotaxis protein